MIFGFTSGTKVYKNNTIFLIKHPKGYEPNLTEMNKMHTTVLHWYYNTYLVYETIIHDIFMNFIARYVLIYKINYQTVL